jgi:hypothetical protein
MDCICLMKHFHDTGSVSDKKLSGLHSVLSYESVENVNENLLQSQ